MKLSFFRLFGGKRRRCSGWMLPLSLIHGLAFAEPIELSGHLRYQSTGLFFEQPAAEQDVPAPDAPTRDTSVAADDSIVQNIDARLNFTFEQNATAVVVQGELLSQYLSEERRPAADGGTSTIDSSGSGFDDDRRAFDASVLLGSSDRHETRLRLDRAYLQHGLGRAIIRVGRQAITWGNGLVFSALDVFNPFAPLSIDKEYKTGDDMAFLEAPLGEYGDVQSVAVLRSDPVSKNPSSDESSFGSKARIAIGELDSELAIAQHYGESFLGVGFSRGLLDGVVRADFAAVDVAEADWRSSYLLNLDRSFVWLDRTWYLFVEYFHSGLGVDEAKYASPDQALLQRLNRGELFTLGKRYLAPGYRIELSPLSNYFGTVLLNLADQSSLIQQQVSSEWSQNVELLLGTTISTGARGTEFGGFPLAQPPGAEQVVPQSIYVRLSYYF